MAVRIVAYRLTPAERQREARIRQITRERVVDTYGKILPGSSIQWHGGGYLACWDKLQ
ncbi:MAG: hypothetical protein M1570_02825 [Chloroflexi bacterium]|nr:hypothetical protein [Chloroflexota bacterium]